MYYKKSKHKFHEKCKNSFMGYYLLKKKSKPSIPNIKLINIKFEMNRGEYHSTNAYCECCKM
jgi:hypothetical protein